jgi:hypothetical protein
LLYRRGARRLDPFLGKIFGKPDAAVAPLQARIFRGRQPDQFVAAVIGRDRDRAE